MYSRPIQQGGGREARSKSWKGGLRDAAGASKQSAIGQREYKRSSGREVQVRVRSQRSLLGGAQIDVGSRFRGFKASLSGGKRARLGMIVGSKQR